MADPWPRASMFSSCLRGRADTAHKSACPDTQTEMSRAISAAAASSAWHGKGWEWEVAWEEDGEDTQPPPLSAPRNTLYHARRGSAGVQTPSEGLWKPFSQSDPSFPHTETDSCETPAGWQEISELSGPPPPGPQSTACQMEGDGDRRPAARGGANRG